MQSESIIIMSIVCRKLFPHHYFIHYNLYMVLLHMNILL